MDVEGSSAWNSSFASKSSRFERVGTIPKRRSPFDHFRFRAYTYSKRPSIHPLVISPDSLTFQMLAPQERPTLLVVGGWSPGPLIYLSSAMASYRVVQPRSLPMPPFPGSWCCYPKVLSAWVVCGMFLWVSCQSGVKIAWKLLCIAATTLILRVLAAVAVRTSIETAANSCLEAIRPYHRNNVVLIGFSWGGAVGLIFTAVDRLLGLMLNSSLAGPRRPPNRLLQICWPREN